MNLINLKETRGLRNGTYSFNDFWYTNMQKNIFILISYQKLLTLTFKLNIYNGM